MFQNIGDFTVYTGLIVLDGKGIVYREVTERDIDAKRPIYRVKLAGLEYQDDIAKLGEVVEIIGLEAGDVKFGVGPQDLLYVKALDEFTGQNRPKDELPEYVFLVPVTVAVYDKHTTRDSSSLTSNFD